uniref:Uncharacterized protein n=1 Tax=Siphoviridae sp. ctGkF2 TaxID=2827823 RepID=A0A8S5TMF4_9CAUD|nr:MAG TPA: hypothetical protein [Siphoviridae sp. ctGkF2]
MFTFDAENVVQELASAVAERVAWNVEFSGIEHDLQYITDTAVSDALEKLQADELQGKSHVIACIKHVLETVEFSAHDLFSPYTVDLHDLRLDNKEHVDNALVELGGFHDLGCSTIDELITQCTLTAIELCARQALDETAGELSELVDRVFDN